MLKKSEYTWTLNKYTEIRRKHNYGNMIEGPIFPGAEGNYKWQLRLYPNGIMGAPNHVSLYLCLATELRDNITVKFAFSLRNTENDLIVRKEHTHIFGYHPRSCGTHDLIYGDSLKKLINKDDILQIHIVVLIEALQTDMTSIKDFSSFVKLLRDIEDMFTTSEFKDFAIKFNDKTEVTVHRAILAARSPVFAAMFRHDVSENKVGFTEIVDIDKATMMHLLTYIYTGKTKQLSYEEAINLLVAADKYEIADLPEHCCEVVEGNITEFNAMDILILAEVHRMSKMKKIAFEYILGKQETFSDQKCLEKLSKYPSLVIEFSSKMFIQFRYKLGYV